MRRKSLENILKRNEPIQTKKDTVKNDENNIEDLQLLADNNGCFYDYET